MINLNAMSSMSSSVSALDAFSTGMQATATNISHINTGTENSKNSLRTTFSDSTNGTVEANVALYPYDADYAQEVANSIVYSSGYSANTKVVQTSDSLLGTILDLKV